MFLSSVINQQWAQSDTITFTKQRRRNKMRLLFHPWSVFTHDLIRCGLQGNTAQCDPPVSKVFFHTHFLWACMGMNGEQPRLCAWCICERLFSACQCERERRENRGITSGCRGESLEILLIWGYPRGQGDTWHYQGHWLETSTGISTDGYAWANTRV